MEPYLYVLGGILMWHALDLADNRLGLPRDLFCQVAVTVFWPFFTVIVVLWTAWLWFYRWVKLT